MKKLGEKIYIKHLRIHLIIPIIYTKKILHLLIKYHLINVNDIHLKNIKKILKKKTDINDYIDTLKKENEELRNTITSLKENLDTLYKNGSNDSQMNKYIKMGIIDIILYILTGIFIIFIIDLILKYNTKTTTISLENVF